MSGSCKRKVGPKIRFKWEVQLVGGRSGKWEVAPPNKQNLVGLGFHPVYINI